MQERSEEAIIMLSWRLSLKHTASSAERHVDESSTAELHCWWSIYHLRPLISTLCWRKKKKIIILQSNYEINGMAPLCKTELATPIKGTFFLGGGGLNSLEADSGEGKGFCWLLGDDNGIL